MTYRHYRPSIADEPRIAFDRMVARNARMDASTEAPDETFAGAGGLKHVLTKHGVRSMTRDGVERARVEERHLQLTDEEIQVSLLKHRVWMEGRRELRARLELAARLRHARSRDGLLRRLREQAREEPGPEGFWACYRASWGGLV